MRGHIGELPGQRILREVAEKHGVTLAIARGERISSHPHSRAKHTKAYSELCFRLRVELKWQYTKIARFCGRAEHTSILAAIKRGQRDLAGVEFRCRSTRDEWAPLALENYFQGKSFRQIGRSVGRTNDTVRVGFNSILAHHGDSASSPWAE